MAEDNTGNSYKNQSLCKRIIARQASYETERSLVDAQTDVICELLRPDLVKGLVGQKEVGAFEGSRIIESTGPHSARIWQRGFLNSMISRKSAWYRNKVKEPPSWTGIKFKGDDDINQWLQDMADHTSSIYKRSNYYDLMPNFVLDAGTTGSPVMLREQDKLNDRVVFKVPDYSQRWLAKDIFGRDNVCHVKWEWTALEALSFFGEDELPESVKTNLRSGDHYKKSQYLQVIYPAGDPIFKDLPEKDKVNETHAWMEFFVSLDSKDESMQQVLKPKDKGPGYFSRPFSTWHYWRNWHETYGRSIGWWAVYDIRGSNAVWEGLFGEVELQLQPPSWAVGRLAGLLELGPRGQNFASGDEEYAMPPKFIERQSGFSVAIEFADRLKASVERHYHVPLFMMANQMMLNKKQPETAYAYFRAEAENNGQLAPEVEGFEGQVLSDTHDSIIDMELMAEPAYPWGRLPEPPEIIQEFGDGNLDIEFIGRLSMAQVRDREVDNFFRNVGIAELIFGFKPEAIEKIKWVQELERVLEAGDFPQSGIVPQEEYEAYLQAIEQRLKQAEVAENAPKLAKAAKDLQGETKKGSPLSALGGAA